MERATGEIFVEMSDVIEMKWMSRENYPWGNKVTIVTISYERWIGKEKYMFYYPKDWSRLKDWPRLLINPQQDQQQCQSQQRVSFPWSPLRS